MNRPFELLKNHWYAWQMLPGYGGSETYFSPIFIESVKPLRTGKGILQIEFFNAFYAEGVRDFKVDLKVVVRAKQYLIGEILHSPEKRTAVILEISFEWLSQISPDLIKNRPPDATEDIDSYLTRVLYPRQG